MAERNRISSFISDIKVKAGRRQQVRKRSRRLSFERVEDRRLLTTIDLATLVAGQATAIIGAAAGDGSGVSVSNAGDVNGDGFDDMVIGAFQADGSEITKSSAGESYLIFGNESLPAMIDLANLGSSGITIFGIDADDEGGWSVGSGGDINGDGFDDLVIGARYADAVGNAKERAGESYVIFGAASLPATIDLANLASAGITIFGADAGDQSGRSVSSAGDINGDGFDDLVIGASFADASANSKENAGESYVIFGATAFPATIDLADLGPAGIVIFGADTGDNSGRSVSGAGDINGDGFDDLLIGAFQAGSSTNTKPSAGESYVLFGAASLSMEIDLANLGAAGIVLFGTDAKDRSGRSVSSAGDINGDGFDDLVVGAGSAGGSGNAKPYAGESYVLFGAASLPRTIELTNSGSFGITIFGADTGDYSGSSVSGAGDINGDGFDDLVIGAMFAAASGNAKERAGESYVIFGTASPPATIDLANSNSAGITVIGADAFDRTGRSVSSAGDINGDGFDDLLVGAYMADAPRNTLSDAGEAYVIFGGNSFTNSILEGNVGTNEANIINGTSAAQILNGADGDDTLKGLGGADVLLGSRGNDVLTVNDLAFNRLVGGNGFDTLRLVGSDLNLDLTNIADNRITGIEQLTLAGSGNHTLTLDHREVLNLSKATNTLLVRRDAGDVVNRGIGWTQIANETIDNVPFEVFTQGAATLKVQDVSPVITLSRSVAAASEDAGVSTVTAMMSAVSESPVTIFLGFTGTATLSSDYALTKTQMVIPAGQTSGSVTITTTQDTLDEGDETIIVSITAVTNGIEATPQQVIVTITDDDGPTDYGDAPALYPVTLAQNGARHIVGPLYLGAIIDAETDGAPALNADSDDNDDGVAFLSNLISTTVPTISCFSVLASQAGKLDAWIDFNNDGDWKDAGEQIYSSVDIAEGVNLLSVTIPAVATTGSTGVRFRLSSLGGLTPTGKAVDGEVEDYVADVIAGSSSAKLDIDVPVGKTKAVIAGDSLVVHQGSTVISKVPFESFGDLNLRGSSLDDILELTILESLSTKSLEFDGGVGKDLLRLFEMGQLLDLTSANVTVRDIEVIDLAGNGSNKLVISVEAVKAASSTTDTLEIVSDAGSTISFGDGWKIDSPSFINGVFTHIISESATGGTARIEVRNDRPLTNPLTPFDVDRDGTIQPLDALRIINALSRQGSRPVMMPTNGAEVSDLYFDVSGDMQFTSLDALRVINALSRINRNQRASDESNVEFASTNPLLVQQKQSVLANSIEILPFSPVPEEFQASSKYLDFSIRDDIFRAYGLSTETEYSNGETDSVKLFEDLSETPLARSNLEL